MKQPRRIIAITVFMPIPFIRLISSHSWPFASASAHARKLFLQWPFAARRGGAALFDNLWLWILGHVTKEFIVPFVNISPSFGCLCVSGSLRQLSLSVSLSASLLHFSIVLIASVTLSVFLSFLVFVFLLTRSPSPSSSLLPSLIHSL